MPEVTWEGSLLKQLELNMQEIFEDRRSWSRDPVLKAYGRLLSIARTAGKPPPPKTVVPVASFGHLSFVPAYLEHLLRSGTNVGAVVSATVFSATLARKSCTKHSRT